MKISKRLVLIIALAVGLSMTGCGNSSDLGNGGSTVPEFITIGTAGTGGAYYPIGIAMGDILTNTLSLQATAQVTGGAVENNILLRNGEIDLAITQGPMAYAAQKGTEPYDQSYEDIRLMFSGLSQGVFHLVVRDDSDIYSIADLKGKRVAMGPAGGGAINVFNDVTREYGFDVDDISATYISYAEGTEALGDRNIDAVVVQSAIPAAAITQLAATNSNFRILSIENDVLEKLLEKYPYYSEISIDQSAYNLDHEVTTIYLSNMVVVDAGMSKDAVYEMTKAFFDHIETITESHPAASGLTIEGAVENLPIPLHPGAEQYFNEQGVL